MAERLRAMYNLIETTSRPVDTAGIIAKRMRHLTNTKCTDASIYEVASFQESLPTDRPVSDLLLEDFSTHTISNLEDMRKSCETAQRACVDDLRLLHRSMLDWTLHIQHNMNHIYGLSKSLEASYQPV